DEWAPLWRQFVVLLEFFWMIGRPWRLIYLSTVDREPASYPARATCAGRLFIFTMYTFAVEFVRFSGIKEDVSMYNLARACPVVALCVSLSWRDM
ncbi:MAG: hypothetical protein ABI192_17685, partial [Bradyrhizobium sp.]